MAINKTTQYSTGLGESVSKGLGGLLVSGSVIYVDTVADLQAIDTSELVDGQAIKLTTTSRAGEFIWRSGDQSSSVSADEVTAGEGDGGIWVAPASDKTGASGAWMRKYNMWGDDVLVGWYGADVTNSDNSPSIQKALDKGLSTVCEQSGVYTCLSSVVMRTVGQDFRGSGKGDITSLDFSSSKINGIEIGTPTDPASHSTLRDIRVLGMSDADTDRNAAVKIVNMTRGVIDNVYGSGFAIGVSWENNTRGWANSIRDVYMCNNRIAGAYLWGQNHATSFFGGELAQGKYGAVVGRLNSDGTIDDDFGANTGGGVTFQGTIIEGQSDYALAICNGQLGVSFDGYMESGNAMTAFVRIGSQYKNDGTTLATAVSRGIWLRGHAASNVGTGGFPAVKIGAVVGGGCEMMISGDLLQGIDTSATRFSSNFDTSGMWVSSGNYVPSASNATVSADIYPATRTGGSYSRRYLTYSDRDAVFKPSLVIPRSWDLPFYSDREGNGKVYRAFVDGSEVGYLESISGRLDIVSKGSVTRWKNDTMEVNMIDSGGSNAFSPGTDNFTRCGNGSLRWTEVFAATGTINTSDEREKQQQRGLSAAEKAVGLKLKDAIKMFKWNEAVERKGADGARWHIGWMAQEVVSIFESEGLDPFAYGAVCYDEWDEELEQLDKDGNVTVEYRPAGNLYGVRKDQIHDFVLAVI